MRCLLHPLNSDALTSDGLGGGGSIIEESQAVESEKRAHLRVPARIKVVYELDGDVVEARSQDLSLGGMFIETSRPLPIGATLAVQLSLPALSAPATVQTVVRWVKSDGMGVAFGALRAAETWAINELTSAHGR